MAYLRRVHTAVPADPPPTRKALLALAGQIQQQYADLIAGDPGLLAAVDQDEAAAAAWSAQLAQLARPELTSVLSPDHSGRALRLRLLIAVLRHVSYACEHLTWPPQPGSNYLAFLTSRTAVCRKQSCGRLLDVHREADRRCECCEQESSLFAPHIVPLGGGLIHLECCPSCSFDLRAGRLHHG